MIDALDRLAAAIRWTLAGFLLAVVIRQLDTLERLDDLERRLDSFPFALIDRLELTP